MSEPTKTMIVAIVIGMLTVGIIGLYLDNQSLRAELDVLPSLEQIQERIGAVPDGIWGEETMMKWDMAICQQYADLYITKDNMRMK